MSYLDAGYNAFLTDQANLDFNSSQIDPLASDTFVQTLSGSKMTGLIQSEDGRIKIDLDNNSIVASDGVVERVRFGKQDDGSYGFLIRDQNNNILQRFDDNNNLIQSPNKYFLADFNAEYILAKDAGGTPRALFGKGDF